MRLKYPLLYQGVLIYRSLDAGKSWESPTTIGSERPIDRPWMTVDRTQGPNRGRLYVSLVDNSSSITYPFTVFSSIDQGKSFSESINPIPVKIGIHPGQNGVFSDGTFIAAYGALGDDSAIYAVTSKDGGRTLSEAIKIASAKPGRHAHFIPTLAIDQSEGPFNDRVYVGWIDGSDKGAQPWYSYSADRGLTWSEARPVDHAIPFDPEDLSKGPLNIHPAIAVNKMGVVGYFWYDRRDMPDGGFRPRIALSFDGSETWSASASVANPTTSRLWGKLNPHLADLNYVQPGKIEKNRPLSLIYSYDSRAPSLLSQHGDHSSMVADANGIFHPVWVGDSTGVPQAWSIAITATGKITKRSDVTAETALEFGEHKFDESSGAISINVRVINKSKKSIVGPLVVDVLYNNWFMERLRIIKNADNSWIGSGATWAFKSTRKDGLIQPGNATESRTIVIQQVRCCGRSPVPYGQFKFRVLSGGEQ